MRDRWVALYFLLVLLQVPFYFVLGEGPVKFDFATREAERRLQGFQGLGDEGETVERSLQQSHAELERMGDDTSRIARVKLNESILAWKSGKSDAALEALEESYRVFAEKQGPDSFHVAAVDLRLAELLYLQRRYKEADTHYKRSSERVRESLGPRHPFVVRMAFREVCTLVALGRSEEAQKIASANFSLLKLVSEEQDKPFMATTGDALDVLRRQGRFGVSPPEGFGTWRGYLPTLSSSQQSESFSD